MMTYMKKLLATYEPIQQVSKTQNKAEFIKAGHGTEEDFDKIDINGDGLVDKEELADFGKPIVIDGKMLRQCEAQAQCYNAENILVEDGNSPWIAEASGSNEPPNAWFILDLMGAYTIDSIAFDTIRYTIQQQEVIKSAIIAIYKQHQESQEEITDMFEENVGKEHELYLRICDRFRVTPDGSLHNGWIDGEVTIGGGSSVGGPWDKLLEPIGARAAECVNSEISEAAKQSQVSFIKVERCIHGCSSELNTTPKSICDCTSEPNSTSDSNPTLNSNKETNLRRR